MTGDGFRQALKDAGYNQGQFAAVMGVHRTLIGRLCAAAEVEPHWVFALAGLVAARQSAAVSGLVAEYDLAGE